VVADSTGLPEPTTARGWHRTYAVPILVVALLALFLAAPWPLHDKARAALHGLCSQRPSHSLTLGDRTLPFDARMTGIYGGFLVSAAYLVARGRLRANRLPPPLTLAALGLFVAALAVDGTNSFLLDVGVQHPYDPDNRLRLLTGLLTGVALAAVLGYLLGTTLWRPRRDGEDGVPVVTGTKELAVLLALQVPFALAVLSGVGWLYAGIAVLLLLAALAAVSSLVLVAVVLVEHGDGAFTDPAQAQRPAALAVVLAIVVMAAIGGGRFLLEHLTGVPPLT
jgi:uncharacterized membrane protein